jgi:hypothetical protein
MLVFHREEKACPDSNPIVNRAAKGITVMRKVSPESARKSRGQNRRLSTEDIVSLVDKAIWGLHDMLDNASAKFSAGDLVRLVQLRKELSDEQPGSVTVRWVDECKETSSEE